MRIAFAGLALTHPFTFARCLRQLGQHEFVVYDEDAGKVEAFVSEFGAQSAESLDQLADKNPNGVMVCCRSDQHLTWTRPFVTRGIPAFVDKVLAVSEPDLWAFDELRRAGTAPLMSTSAVRFGTMAATMADELERTDNGPITLVQGMVNHHISPYLRPGNTWQDELGMGGGTIVNMGIHGVEPLVKWFGTPQTVTARAARRRFHDTQSEDTALLSIEFPDGLLAALQIVSGCDYEPSQEFEVFAARRRLTATNVDQSGDRLEVRGYLGLCRAFLQMVSTGTSPIPWDQTIGVVATLLAARASATSGRPEQIRVSAQPSQPTLT